MYPILINTKSDYNLVLGLGFSPLNDWQRFKIDILLRIELQRAIFGHTILGPGNIPQANQRFYHFCWEHSIVKCCEECQLPLSEYSAVFISHILSRAGYPEMAHDPRNHNLLCGTCHHKWEKDNNSRSLMKIRKKNNRIIRLLNADYKTI